MAKATKDTKEQEAETPVSTEATAPAPEMVEISKEDLLRLVEQTKESAAAIKRLEYAASKARLEVYDGKQNGDAIGKVVSVRVYDGKRIAAWRLLTNDVQKNPLTGVWEERQVVEVMYFGEEDPIVLDYRTLERGYEKEKVEVLDETTSSSTGITTFKIKAADGTELEIDSTFVN
jgi:hypothetical protein